jgi:glucosamine-phosphate N-acetyltransferase
MNFRKLECDDYEKSYFELLSQLTVCEKVSFEKFKNFVQNLNENHLIIVYEKDNKILASGTLFIENKIIRNCCGKLDI